MILKKVTFTGVDDWISVRHLFDIWRDNQFIEWGILYSESKMGEKRYPSKRKILDFVYSNNMHKSLHICGFASSNISQKGFISNDILYLVPGLNRIQLNFNSQKTEVNLGKFLSRLEDFHIPFILQVNKNNKQLIDDISSHIDKNKIHYLFDSSCGEGVEIIDIPVPIKDKICGWCGGLNPDNLHQKLEILEKELPKDLPIWIDMESGIRTDDYFDISKVIKCVDIINEYINNDAPN
jgi:phosphoribosylanthranilate isomerase